MITFFIRLTRWARSFVPLEGIIPRCRRTSCRSTYPDSNRGYLITKEASFH
jgi:hypothetical protein